ncbi:techylectin-5A, partial [Caerostris darwini]
VIQRRGNFTPKQDFYNDWKSYKAGFGNITRDFWLGNDNIYALSNQGACEIRFDIKDAKGNHRYAVYKSFRIENEKSLYALSVSGYSGNAGDGMKFHDGYRFSTKDKENIKCASELHGAWWFYDFAHVHLNANYQPGIVDPKNIHWYPWLKNEGLAFVEMKLRLK